VGVDTSEAAQTAIRLLAALLTLAICWCLKARQPRPTAVLLYTLAVGLAAVQSRTSAIPIPAVTALASLRQAIFAGYGRVPAIFECIAVGVLAITRRTNC